MQNTTLLFVIAGLLLAAIVGVMLFQVFRERAKKKKAKKMRQEIVQKQKDLLRDISARVNATIEYNDTLLSSFVVSVGELKMREINNIAKESLLKICNDKDYKNLFLDNVESEDSALVEAIDKISMQKSNLWNKKENETILYFKELEYNFLNGEESTKYQETKNQILEELKNEN